ncbi:hypothetical protein CMI37_32850 [Candidatus Pacearchaeota archaeon]|nr:hypothetical protein [Candidatus Pacearchaeota archaeon]|tara:strand:+ start:5707 stop:7977 length:2271 start_codon:yes stop_codon:yes gene_type:complete
MAIIDSTGKQYQTNNSELKPDMGELASAGYDLYGSGKIMSYNPDSLIGRKGFDIYDQMRIDDQVKACLTLKKFATLAPSYQIIPVSNDEQDEEVADYVRYCMDKIDGNIIDALLEILTALDYGFSITEINYKTFQAGVHKGKIGLKNLKTKQPHYYSFEVDKFGNLTKKGIISTLGSVETSYPISKFLIFSYQKEFSNWYGTSDLRPAYRGYWSKDVLIKMWNIYLERFANPTVIGKYKSNDPTSRTNLRSILDNLTAKTSITHRLDEFDIQFLESTRNATGDFKDALDFNNKAIARSILIPDRLMAAGDTGAYSQAKIHFDVFLWVIQKLRQDIADTVMNEQLIKRLVAYNYSNVTELPKFTFNPMTDDQKQALNTMFITAVEKGVIVPTLEDENILREHLSFPAKDLSPDKPEEEITEEVDIDVVEEVAENKKFEKLKNEELEKDNPFADPFDKNKTKVPRRPKNRAEKRVDFKAVNNAIDKLEIQFLDNIRTVMNKQMESVITYITNKMNQDKFDFTAIENLDLKYKGDLSKVFEKGYQDAFDVGKEQAKDSLPKRFLKTKIGEGIRATGFERFFKSKARLDVKRISATLNNNLMTTLLDSIVKGHSIPQTTLQIQGAFNPYVADGSEIEVTRTGKAKLVTDYRATTLVRTATLGAYNYGRREIGEDKDVKDFMIGYQVSSILDERTTEVCELVAEYEPTIKVENIGMINELTPPLHFNCRSILVFLTKDDQPIQWSSDAILSEIIDMSGMTE